MSKLLLTVALLSALLAVSSACKCKEQSTKESFCNAHWVSHVKVKVRVGKQGLPEGSERKGLNNLRYTVQHVEVFKKPSNMTTLPDEIYTPSESPACGLTIAAGHEYLLAGRVEGPNALYTVLCGQVLPDDRSQTSFENVLEWKNVPQSLQTQIKAIKC
ncbi:Protein CBR-TAG-225 [Caenorhabditis briggsae]|uniref:NTR domain-containing protein n=2 Tax=Caenorhabditis briggsae TaxID=6238 RepID=A0AAE9CXD1_CAEBR|nr:Protein CBR-TAG-225 [Caenorhabditis briggsae]ULT86050.1 hypothetical protein L3Y34_006025 [Caenorhabditis briggsae]UMM31806.1 hypothetical protein L5515_005856 [Caenorhabditis briggsae]CAP30619.1 Protein CBR-TAG-225 [Caenorhabditis briggsae]